MSSSIYQGLMIVQSSMLLKAYQKVTKELAMDES